MVHDTLLWADTLPWVALALLVRLKSGPRRLTDARPGLWTDEDAAWLDSARLAHVERVAAKIVAVQLDQVARAAHCGGSVRLPITHTRQTRTDNIGDSPRAFLSRGLMTGEYSVLLSWADYAGRASIILLIAAGFHKWHEIGPFPCCDAWVRKWPHSGPALAADQAPPNFDGSS